MKYKLKIRYIVLCTLLLVVWATQLIPAMGKIYAHSVYPVIAYILSSFSRLIPFAIGDLFIALSIAGVLLYPAYARRFQKKKWKRILLNDIEYLYGYTSGSIWLGDLIIHSPVSTNGQRFLIPHTLPRTSGTSLMITLTN